MRTESQPLCSLVSIFISKMTYFNGERQSATQMCLYEDAFSTTVNTTGTYLTFIDQFNLSSSVSHHFRVIFSIF